MKPFTLITSILTFCLLLGLLTVEAQTMAFQVEKQRRKQLDTTQFELVEETESWQASQTALIICDMWNKHWCPTATERVEELAPYMNEVVKIARDKGVFIIHAPSGVTDFYNNHPARKRAIEAPKSNTLPEEIQSWCSWLDEHEEKVYPIDQSDGGCECEDCESYTAWTRQVADIEIKDQDAISDSGRRNMESARSQRHSECYAGRCAYQYVCAWSTSFWIKKYGPLWEKCRADSRSYRHHVQSRKLASCGSFYGYRPNSRTYRESMSARQLHRPYLPEKKLSDFRRTIA